MRPVKPSRGLVAAAIRLAADPPVTNPHSHGRVLVKRSLIDELRRELDLLGVGEDWRLLNKLVRIEEKTPEVAGQPAGETGHPMARLPGPARFEETA